MRGFYVPSRGELVNMGLLGGATLIIASFFALPACNPPTMNILSILVMWNLPLLGILLLYKVYIQYIKQNGDV